MKLKLSLKIITVLLLTISTTILSQDKGSQYFIIEGDTNVKKYHTIEVLEEMGKGDLLKLYTERIEVIIKILPNIAFATKPGVSMTTLGIPDSKDNRKAFEKNQAATNEYFDDKIKFQEKILPYSDKIDLISAILFYEETLKALNTYSEFN